MKIATFVGAIWACRSSSGVLSLSSTARHERSRQLNHASLPFDDSSSRRRRKILLVAGAACTVSPKGALALFEERRQLELCLVSLQRVLYWALGQADRLRDDTASMETLRQAYLETRLGAKAVLTGKIGPGATASVYTVGSLQFPSCLNDLKWHASKSANARKVSDIKEELVENFAFIVEFDGLETLTDPSPRSSLTLSQYTDDKRKFVLRILRELVLPKGQELLYSFDTQTVDRSMQFLQRYYVDEMPATLVEKFRQQESG